MSMKLAMVNCIDQQQVRCVTILQVCEGEPREVLPLLRKAIDTTNPISCWLFCSYACDYIAAVKQTSPQNHLQIRQGMGDFDSYEELPDYRYDVTLSTDGDLEAIVYRLDETKRRGYRKQRSVVLARKKQNVKGSSNGNYEHSSNPRDGKRQ